MHHELNTARYFSLTGRFSFLTPSTCLPAFPRLWWETFYPGFSLTDSWARGLLDLLTMDTPTRVLPPCWANPIHKCNSHLPRMRSASLISVAALDAVKSPLLLLRVLAPYIPVFYIYIFAQMRPRSLSRKEPERKPPVRRVKSKRPLKKSVVIPLLFFNR